MSTGGFTGNFIPGVISILLPTRNRPRNVERFLESAIATASNFENLEFIFYIDDDDNTFPSHVLRRNVKLVKGPRLWLSVIGNILYSHSRGEIIMYAGDDLIFSSKGWDELVLAQFNTTSDKIRLVYGNDKGRNSKEIARHGFLHRKWIETIGVYQQPGRGSASDIWLTSVARKIGRLDYIENLIIPHIHWWQGDRSAVFDQTYAEISNLVTSWRPRKTYMRLERERRIDRILLSEVMNPKPKIEYKYALGEFLCKNRHRLHLMSVDGRKLRSLQNHEFVSLVFTKFFLKIIRK